MKVYSLQFTVYRIIFTLLFTFYFLLSTFYISFAQEKEPIVVNGDKVEYFAEEKKVEASGNVVITYQDIRLTCDKVTVFTDLKQAEAMGNVHIEEKKGIIEGERVVYNFETKQGILIEAKVQAPPFYGKSEIVKKISESELELKKGYVTTCDLMPPHYRIQSKEISVYLDDKVVARDVIFKAGEVPLMYLPTYVHPLTDKRPRVTIVPGHYKDWGTYLLTAWRYYFSEGAKGRIYLDWRENKGIAEGIDYNYLMKNLGSGKLKLYYMQERDRNIPEGFSAEKERFLVQLKHKTKIDKNTEVILEYHRMKDKDFLKDYFFREYEKDYQPKTYLLITRSMPFYSLNLLTQKRTNRFYEEVERLPEIKLDINEQKVLESPFYFKNTSSLSNLIKKNTAPSDVDTDVVRFDTYNQISIPKKISFLETKPYVGFRETCFTKDINGDENKFRSIFYSGIDLSTRFFRIYNFKTDFLDLDINRIRHVINPQIRYSYIHSPTILSSKLMQFDDIDSISRENRINLYLENKLQTKREDKIVDILRFICDTDYLFKPEEGSRFSDFKFDLELLPYSWLRFEQDLTYDSRDRAFKTVNSDLSASGGEKWYFGVGHRYQRTGESELTSEVFYRINPKWKVRAYERFQFDTQDLKEQEYTIYRDLHCWEMEITYNIKRGYGKTIWIVFRLKAFPEMGFEFNKSYHQPKPGSQR